MSPGVSDLLNGRYRIEGKLGEGGMGAVYRAFDTLYDRPCAVKELRLGHLPSADATRLHGATEPYVPAPLLTREQAIQQFRLEARLLARLDHTNLPKVGDYFALGDQCYLVMDLIEGEDLDLKAAAAKEGRLSEAQVLKWADQAMDALAYCHSQGVIHRDVKPGNLIVTPSDRVYLVDFGIAKADPAGKTMFVSATPRYSPPEQLDAEASTDERSDVYALGATLYRLLTGREPEGAIQRMRGKTLTRPRSIARSISKTTDQALVRALAFDPAERFRSIEQLRQAINGDTGETTTEHESKRTGLSPASPSVRAEEQRSTSGSLSGVRRARRTVYFAVAAAALALVGVTTSLVSTEAIRRWFARTVPTAWTSTATTARTRDAGPVQSSTLAVSRTPSSEAKRATTAPVPTLGPPTATLRPAPTRPPTWTPRPLTATPTPVPYAVVTAGPLNVRAGPSTDFAELTSVSEGERLRVHGRSAGGGWINVTTPTGVIGWVSVDFVRLTTVIRNVPVVTVAPTATPDPSTNPRFRADRTAISAGECTFLRWDVEGVQAVYLDGAGRPGQSVEQVCPLRTYTYTLTIVRRDGARTNHRVTIQVTGTLPLAILVEQTGIWCPTASNYSMRFKIHAQGGTGRYTYYRDDDQIGTSTGEALIYDFLWQRCGAAVGTFIVRSDGGQEAREKFYVAKPACCTK